MGAALSSLTRLMHLASRVICLIVIAWLVVFVVDQTGSASAHQQNEVIPGSAPTGTPSSEAGAGSAAVKAKPESTARKTLNEVAEALTSPFAGAVSGSHSEWTIHIVKTLLALLVYGFGLAFLARFISVRV
jgi:hypothetical protein